MARNQRRNKRNKQGGTRNANRTATRDNVENRPAGAGHRRWSTETKPALKTTELIAYAGAVLAVIITALAVNEDGQGGNDPFGAESAIRYITYLTIGYLLARGLAKSGSYEDRTEHDTDTDTARTGAVPDVDAHDDARDDETLTRDDDERIVGDTGAETADVQSDRPQHPAADNDDSRS